MYLWEGDGARANKACPQLKYNYHMGVSGFSTHLQTAQNFGKLWTANAVDKCCELFVALKLIEK